MNPIRKVLVPIDFSDASKRALDYGLNVAREFDGELVLLHVSPKYLDSRYTMFIPAVEEEFRHLKDAERDMSALIPEEGRNLQVRILATEGRPEEEILKLVDEEAIDLVVMGGHGRRRFKRWFLGSVTEHILRKIPVPVMSLSQVEQGVEPRLSEPLRFERILYPTDFSDCTEIALPMALGFTRRFRSELTLVHVVERLHRSPTSPSYTDEELEEERRSLVERAESALSGMAPADATPGVAVRKVVLEGKASQAILKYVEESGADLIVMSLHGMSFIERALLGATAERVVRASSVPVLSIPPARERIA